jgi:peroxiredoxin
MSGVLPVGTSAPGFTLRATPGQDLSLNDLAGRPVILAYPADWSPVCGDQMALYHEVLPEFHNAELPGHLGRRRLVPRRSKAIFSAACAAA